MNDHEIQNLIALESHRQNDKVNLIASENYVSADVLLVTGSVLTNKYAEGYSRARYYAGNEYIDQIEELCQNRALTAFGVSAEDWAVNVQSYSGSPANMAIYQALVPHGGKIMGLDLSHGGHLTHGYKVSVTGKIWHQVPYFVEQKTEILDYQHIAEIATAEKPDIIVAGYTAYSRVIDWKKLREIADICGALLHADISHISGLIITKNFPSPFEYADTVMTTTHKTLRGPRGALIFSKKDIRNLDKKIDKTIFPGMQGGPHMNQIGAVAVALQESQTLQYFEYISQVIKNAKVMAQTLQNLGWRIVSEGTDTHLFIVDTWNGGAGISGKTASELLEQHGIIVNMNTIPYDTRSPQDPSGIRIGTPAITTQGKNEVDAQNIAITIDKILRNNI